MNGTIFIDEARIARLLVESASPMEGEGEGPAAAKAKADRWGMTLCR